MFKFNMYAAMSRDNPWYGLMNGADQTDEEQDSIKVWARLVSGRAMPSDLSWEFPNFVQLAGMNH